MLSLNECMLLLNAVMRVGWVRNDRVFLWARFVADEERTGVLDGGSCAVVGMQR